MRRIECEPSVEAFVQGPTVPDADRCSSLHFSVAQGPVHATLRSVHHPNPRTKMEVTPNIRLVRWAAAILIVSGFFSPFLANLIDQSLGA